MNPVAILAIILVAAMPVFGQTTPGGYCIVDTSQTNCYNNTTNITSPPVSQPFYGQDAQYNGQQSSYTLSVNGLTVNDNNTGLTWQRTPDTTGDGTITASDKLTWTQAQARPDALNAISYGGYNDWRLPTIKELYSLMNFMGTDVGPGSDVSTLTPFIDRTYFSFGYGDTTAGERVIDAQYASSNPYVSKVMLGDPALFGVNFADGRIKGYDLVNTMSGPGDAVFYVQCVRGAAYGTNDFVDNGDSTITDRATGLMWCKADSGTGLNWQESLTWAQTKNTTNYLGHSDWRLPNAKELQSIVDYTRSPDTTTSAAIDPLFTCTGIINEAGKADYPFYWTGTTHISSDGTGANAIYIAFGRALGYMTMPNNPAIGAWLDVHGAGAQRSDPKTGNPADYPNGRGPQGDAIRIYNYVRLVRTAFATGDSVGDGIPDWWRAQYFGGDGGTVITDSAATDDSDHDGVDNLHEYLADSIPTDALSYFHIQSVTKGAGFSVYYQSSASRTYTLYSAADLTSGAWAPVAGQINIAGSGGVDELTDPSPASERLFYRIGVQVP